MVEVTVRIQQHSGLQFVKINKRFELILFVIEVTTGVNNEAFALFVVEYVRVFLNRIESKNLDLKHSVN